ncbi:Oxygen-insensitive NADPH nitroreductase [Aeromonas hydrophila]
MSEAVGLPHQVIPLFGLCLGHPAQAPEQKPRLPRALVVHENRYQTELDRELLAGYDQQFEAYYQSRSSNNKQQSWSGQIRGILGKEARPFMQDFLRSRGFNLK